MFGTDSGKNITQWMGYLRGYITDLQLGKRSDESMKAAIMQYFGLINDQQYIFSDDIYTDLPEILNIIDG